MGDHAKLLRVGLITAESDEISWTFPFTDQPSEDDRKAFAYCGYTSPEEPDSVADCRATLIEQLEAGRVPHVVGKFGFRMLAKTGALDGFDSVAYFDIQKATKAYASSLGLKRSGLAFLAEFTEQEYDVKDVLGQCRFLHSALAASPPGDYMVEVNDLGEQLPKLRGEL